MSMHPETWEQELSNPEDKERWARQYPHLARSRSAEFQTGHQDAKKDWVYEGEPLESNYLRNRYGD